MKNHQNIKKSLEPLISGSFSWADNADLLTAPTTIITAFKTHSASASLMKKHQKVKKKPVFTQKSLEPPQLHLQHLQNTLVTSLASIPHLNTPFHPYDTDIATQKTNGTPLNVVTVIPLAPFITSTYPIPCFIKLGSRSSINRPHQCFEGSWLNSEVMFVLFFSFVIFTRLFLHWLLSNFAYLDIHFLFFLFYFHGLLVLRQWGHCLIWGGHME